MDRVVVSEKGAGLSGGGLDYFSAGGKAGNGSGEIAWALDGVDSSARKRQMNKRRFWSV